MRAVRLDALAEREADAKPEHSDKLAARAEAIREELLTDAANRAPRTRPDAPLAGNTPRLESEIAFIRRRLIEVVETGSGAEVVRASEQLLDRFGLDPRETRGPAASLDAELQALSRHPLPELRAALARLKAQIWRLKHPDNRGPVALEIAAATEPPTSTPPTVAAPMPVVRPEPQPPPPASTLLSDDEALRRVREGMERFRQERQDRANEAMRANRPLPDWY